MKTSIGLFRWRRAVGVAGLGVVIVGVTTLAAPRRNHSVLERKYNGAVLGELAPGTQAKEIVVLDDATKARGSIASGDSAETPAFEQPNDSGFGWFMKDDDVFGYGTWATQQIFGHFFHHVPTTISAYDLLIFHDDAADPDVNASFMTELWDGDPFSIMDTVCTMGGTSAPIPGTTAFFTDLPKADAPCPPIAGGVESACGGLYRLRAELPDPVTVDCDRVWMVTTMLEGCRATWRIAGKDGDLWNAPATEGESNGVWTFWACEQFAACNTPNGYNSGVCVCSNGEACDHTDGTRDCPAGHPTFCGDGAADYFIANAGGAPDAYYSLVSTVFTHLDTVIALVPVSVDAPPGTAGTPPGVISLSEEEVVLTGGDHNVWLEFRIGDWDPDDTGVDLDAWQLTFDAAGYTTGDQGTLTVYTGGSPGTVCFGPGDDVPCAAVLGPAANCDPPGYHLNPPAGVCSYAFIDQDRPDFVFKDAGVPIVTMDVSGPNVRPSGTVIGGPADDPEPFPTGGLYAGTLTLHVPADAKGTFELSLLPFSFTQLLDHDTYLPFAIHPAKITVQTGRCCFNLELEESAGCVDTLMTVASCLQMPGDTVFTPNGTCDEPISCPACGAIDPPSDPPAESHTLNDKNRYLTFVPTNLGYNTALQVTLVASEQFPEAVGSTWWVGSPSEYCENGAEVNPPCTPVPDVPSDTFLSASLQCQQHCMDWGSLGEPIHVGDINIVPGASYEVRAIPCGCDPGNPANYSAPLPISTSVWGDTVVSCAECPCGPPEGIVNIIDCREVVQRFINAPCKPLKSRVDLEPAVPDRQINITDVLVCIQAFQGLEYDLSAPAGCPR